MKVWQRKKHLNGNDLPLTRDSTDTSNGGTTGLHRRSPRNRRLGQRPLLQFTKTLRPKGGMMQWKFFWVGGTVILCFLVWRQWRRPSYTLGGVIGFLDDAAAPPPWDSPILHIVNTRFMQEQGYLVALGMARWHLFRTFCLPTMVHQVSQDFLWIIKTDPNLHPTLLQLLISSLEGHANFFLVASNTNFLTHTDETGNWKDGNEIRSLDASRIYTGDLTLLREAANAVVQEQAPLVLETRLDADDGLNLRFIQTIQQEALDVFQNANLHWMYWCSKRHIQWHSSSNNSSTMTSQDNDNNNQTNNRQYGNLKIVSAHHECVTPGLTVAFGQSTKSVPVFRHPELYKKIHQLPSDQACGADGGNCVMWVEDLGLSETIRARTPTSAGMMGVQENYQEQRPRPYQTYVYWDLLHDQFAIKREQVYYTDQMIANNVVAIAKDNLKGQCTTHHSCKNSTREKLNKLIKAT